MRRFLELMTSLLLGVAAVLFLVACSLAATWGAFVDTDRDLPEKHV